MTTESYIDRCVDMVAAINAAQLADCELGQIIGESKGREGYVMRALGRVSFGGADVHCGLKIPKFSSLEAVADRTLVELESIELLLSRLPEYSPQVPKFMAVLAVEGGEPIAQLTEDASEGGMLKIWSQRKNAALASKIFDTFSRPDDGGIFVEEENAEYALSFVVGDRQRLLDFTPPPVRFGRFDSNPITERIFELLQGNELQVTLPSNSRLGQALLEVTA